jgi:nucleotide-binding universal stress UspA family protein
MLKALVPVDGSASALSAIRHVIKLVHDREPLEIHLLNVQPPLKSDVTRFVNGSVVRAYHEEKAREALAPASRLLDEAGLAYASHIFVGHVPETIATCAQTLHCDKVIMGTRGLGTVTQLLLGSVTHAVIHLMDPGIPVTLVKGSVAPPAQEARP